MPTSKLSKTLTAISLCASALLLSGCPTDADVVSKNLSKAADQFEINRRIVFYNGITDTYLLTIEGLCSIEDQAAGTGKKGSFGGGQGAQLEVVCKTQNGFKKHFLGLSDNVTYFAEQLAERNVSAYHYRVIFKPQVIIPDIDARGDVDELLSSGE